MCIVYAGNSLIIFTKYVYKVNWGDNPLEIIFIAFSLSVFSISMGLMATMVMKNKDIANAVLQVVIPVMTFVSGGYMKLDSDNNIFTTIQYFLPSRLGQTAFFNSIYNGYSNQIFSSIAVIWIGTIIMGLISVVFGRRKLA